MFLEILLAILVGCLFGVLTGITPGLHINLVAVILLSLSTYLLGFMDVVVVSSFIIAMSITHTFADFIAAIYLGAPGDDTALSVLPGHRMLLRGIGHKAVRLTVLGSFSGLVVVILLSPILTRIVPIIFRVLKDFIGWILLVISVFMILRDKGADKKFWNFLVFFLSGILGIFVLNFHGLENPLLPLFSGLFGISMLVVSLSQKVVIPPQSTSDINDVKGPEFFKSIGAGVFSGSLVSIFPALGPAQAAVLAMQFFKKIGDHTILILLGSINTVSMVISLITLLTIDKARNGSIIVVQKLIPDLGINTFVLFLMVALVSGGIATVLTLKLSKVFSKIITKLKYDYISIFIIIFIVGLVFILTKWIGLFVLIVATSVGIIPVLKKVNRSNLMGSLLLPIILFYLI